MLFIRSLWRLLTALALLALLSACGAATPPPPTAAPAAAPTSAPAAAAPTSAPAATAAPAATPPAANKLPVIATYSILGDMVQNVGGELIDLKVLVGPDGDAHAYEPVPADSASLLQAKVLFENGLEFETWLDDLYTASGSQAVRAVVSEGITPLKAPEEGEHGHAEGESHSASEAGQEEHDHGEFDPHIWHSVANSEIMVANIAKALSAADPTNATIYQANAATYTTQLKELDAFIKQEVATLPAERRKIVTTHDTFGYFAQDYGFEIVGTALGITTETADPSAAQIADLVTDIKATGVPAIFAENIANSTVMETIAKEAGVKLVPELYTDALGPQGSEGETYIKMMRFNTTTMVTALKG